MDIGNVSSMYGDIYKQAAASQAASKLEGRLKSDYSQASDDELMDVCKQFEAYFVEQMYKGMMKTATFGREDSGSNAMLLDYYKDQMIQGIAAQTTEQNGGLGLAKQLYEQMKRNYDL